VCLWRWARHYIHNNVFSFEKTSLWRGSFGNSDFEVEDDSLNLLRECLFSIRSRAAHLVSLIPRDIPGLTVHDISHLDALWETASLIAGESYPLNPAEAFVFGAAVLLHDSAMSLAAYPGGLDEVRRMPEWRDAVASRLLTATGEPIDPKQLDRPPDEIGRAALSDVLRETHALRASELPLIEWPTPNGTRDLLIQDSELREAYGNIIGEIASSHWWPVSELQNLQLRVNAGPNVPSAWFVNPLKIACLLRAADVAHIDHRRAPRFLRTLLRPNANSDVHWAFQTKLGKPSLEKNFLVYSAGSPFTITEAEAWWLGYEMLAAIDDELRAVHGALDRHGLPPFVATAVKGAKSPQAIAELIVTKGWKPVNTELRVSDVPSLVELVGGQRLYGSDLAAPVREMIQNAADAIRALRTMRDLHLERGTITVRLRRTEGTDWLDFEDNGIGMSPRVLTGPLLDFGRSFWRSALLRQEFPGLLSKGLKTTGRFGIGFFSVFMLGDRVTVTSRRYDAAVSDTNTLEFQKGLRVRPILRKPSPTETLAEPGTRISIALRTLVDEPDGLLFRGKFGDKKRLASLREMISQISPAMDVKIEADENGKGEIAVSANDWLTEPAEKLIERTGNGMQWQVPYFKSLLQNLRELRDSTTSESYGRACICPGIRYYTAGVVTVGGFRADSLHEIAGVLRGETESVTRNDAIPSVPAEILRGWATEQGKLIASANVPGEQKLEATPVVLLCGGEMSELPVAIRDGEYLTAVALESLLRQVDEVQMFLGSEIDYDEDDEVLPKAFRSDFTVSATLLLVPSRTASILTVGIQRWPDCVPGLYAPDQPKCCEDIFHIALKRAWSVEPEWDEDLRVVGEVHGEEILREIRIYTRPIDPSVLEKLMA